MTRYRPEELREYARGLLAAGGFAPSHAACTADVLVWANARGADSHGVLRIPRYIEMVEQGAINPVAEPAVTRHEGAVSVLEAHQSPGASAMLMAMSEAITNAARFGFGWCAARNITHAGAVGYYALHAVRQGYLGVVMTASGPLMAYHGSRAVGVSSNPIAFAAPAPGDPVLLDMSTSTAALGKIMAAKDAGAPIPDTWGMDAQGRPTTDPAAVAMLTPLGGPKGSGLSLMIEILASVLAANPVIAPALNGGKAGMNGLAMAIEIGAFGDPARFRDEVGCLVAAIRALPPAPDTIRVLIPGERGFGVAAERLRTGIPLAAGTLKRLAALGDRLGVAAPKPFDEAAPEEVRCHT
jgi:ureidoglycolate dehydrogenase (NAD+)